MLRFKRHISSGVRLLNKVSYSKTLQLPQTPFGPRSPRGDDRYKLINQISDQLYDWQLNRSNYSKSFTLHDGPPYANGDLHLGHALNKILKDIINRFELIHNDSKINYRPGWDCHGLPIEMKALQSIKPDKLKDIKPVQIRKICRELAQLMIELQRKQFKEFGIMTDFDSPYITMNHDYEINQLNVFYKLLENGLLSRQLKPVWWGCQTQTALAEAELEYNPNHKSTAIFVKFFSNSSSLKRKFNLNEQSKLSLLIWTSTPWTIPANQAICVNENLNYSLIHDPTQNDYIVVASDLVNDILKKNELFIELENSPVLSGSDLVGTFYTNPASNTDKQFPVLHGDHVSSGAGSGLVHTAPAHGGEDYLIGRKHGLPILSSVDEKGHFIGNNIPNGFHQLHGIEANSKNGIWSTIDLLSQHDMIFNINKSYKHSYPYDWRSKKPVIQRATPQWFINVGKIKSTAIDALKKVEFVPESGKNRLPSFIQNRNEWCISRQRTWGVPLPIVYNKENGEPIEDLQVIKYLINKIDQLGTDEWFKEENDNIDRWLPLSIDGSKYIKGKDTMDVWFDSGTSWTSLEERTDGKPLADIYLEGSDQHRGWFQSSLLNKIISSGVNGENFKPIAPFAKIITHGFTLDVHNDKMSKSKGNVIAPQQVINGGGKPALPALGTDGLRLWVSSSNYTQDVNVSGEILLRVMENLKKLRLTMKYFLGNLAKFDPAVDSVGYNDLNPLDKWALSRLYRLQQSVIKNYQSHNFQRVVKDLSHHMNTDLSSTYFHISKDCLYTDSIDSVRRRGIQTVLYHSLKTYIGLLAPIQPLLAQETWSHFQDLFKVTETSPFMMNWSNFYELPLQFQNENIEHDFNLIWEVQDHVYKNLEELKTNGAYKNKLETQVSLSTNEDSSICKLLETHQPFLDDYFLVSKVEVNPTQTQGNETAFNKSFSINLANGEQVKGTILPSPHHKCPRCWKFIAEQHDHLCGKCHSVVNN